LTKRIGKPHLLQERKGEGNAWGQGFETVRNLHFSGIWRRSQIYEETTKRDNWRPPQTRKGRKEKTEGDPDLASESLQGKKWLGSTASTWREEQKIKRLPLGQNLQSEARNTKKGGQKRFWTKQFQKRKLKLKRGNLTGSANQRE